MEEFYGQSPYERQEHESTNHAKKVNTYAWNPTTLQWEKNTNTASKLATKIANPSTGIYYIGKAPTGSAAASAVWQISKLDTTTLALEKTWADGNANFDNVWDDRAGYTFS